MVLGSFGTAEDADASGNVGAAGAVAAHGIVNSIGYPAAEAISVLSQHSQRQAQPALTD